MTELPVSSARPLVMKYDVFVNDELYDSHTRGTRALGQARDIKEKRPSVEVIVRVRKGWVAR